VVQVVYLFSFAIALLTLHDSIRNFLRIARECYKMELNTSAQHIKAFKLAIEFKYLTKHAPAGVYVLPEFENFRTLHGVIFVRRGLYRDGIFRFRVDLPPEYNDVNAHPMITFTPPIFNPLVDPSTGRLDIGVDEAFKEWLPDRHFLVSALIFIKKIFYMKNYNQFSRIPNPEAKNL
jgi:ubiquitin-protein ligase